MKTKSKGFTTRASVAAVRGALIAMAAVPAAYTADAYAQSAEELTKPASTVEVGVGYVNRDSAKFGEYNGLDKSGLYLNGNLDLRGGDADSAARWRINGTDLGLETRNLNGEYGQQGKFRFNFGYDELLRNRSDSFQTPYNGAGTNNLILPSNWIVPTVPLLGTGPNARGLNPAVANSNAIVGGVSKAPTAANLATSNTLISTDLPDFHNVNLSTKRTKYDGGFSYSLDQQWDFQFSARHEHKDGLKPMGTVSRNTGGDISTIIPDLIDTDTNQFNASLNYKGDKSHFQAAYYGSVFKNNVGSMSWQNWATGPTGTGTLNTISSAPSNEFHQFGLTGGYKFSSTTKLVVNGSYARTTQNDSFITNSTTPVVPLSSPNALVVTKAFNAKLTARPTKDLNLAANFKYDNRDNRTPVNIYQYADAQEAAVANASFPAGANNPLGAVLAQNANANRPYSKTLNQFNFDADYAVAKGQWLKAGYDFQKIDRYCNGSWIDCADAATTKENTLRAEWRANVMEDLSGRIGYAYSQRRVDNYNENAFLALVPYANVVPAGQTISAYQAMLLSGLTGYGPVSGIAGAGTIPGLTAGQANAFFPSNNVLPNGLYANNNRISELPGMRRFYVADRNRDKLRTSVNWEASERFSLQGGLDFNKDNFNNSVYGLQDARSWALNLDGTFVASEDLTASLFYSYEDQRSTSAGNGYTANSTAANVSGFTAISGGCFATIALRNASNKLDPCNNWSSDQRDKVDTLGLTLTKKNLMSGKLVVAGNLIFTRARSDNNPTGGTYTNNPFAVAGAPAGTVAAFYIPATPLPTVTTYTTELRLNGRYAIDKTSSVRLFYSLARMKSADYSYNSMTDGAIAGQFPTFETAPNFTVYVAGVSYIRSF
jgi:MtrB/PioB family decaheme-associated outer membrane protein